MREDQKNLFLAMGLSLLVIIGWQYFYAAPKLEASRQTAAQVENPKTPPAPNATTPASPVATPQSPGTAPTATATAPEVAADRETVLAASKRIPIDTRSLKGSIPLTGARLDDVALKGYRETVEPNSPNIVDRRRRHAHQLQDGGAVLGQRAGPRIPPYLCRR